MEDAMHLVSTSWPRVPYLKIMFSDKEESPYFNPTWCACWREEKFSVVIV
jgi:hypothetical protein